MQRSDLKKLIKECLIEILSEDFLKRIINEQVADKIQIDVRVPGMTSSSTHENLRESASPMKRRVLSDQERENMRRAVRGDDEESSSTVGGTGDISSLGLNPKVVNTVEEIKNPLFKQLAEDTLKTEARKANQTSTFAPSETNFIDLEKIKAINEAVDNKQQ